MIEILIPGYKKLQLKHLVTDFNGTMACDGKLLDNLEEILEILAGRLAIHILTADTFGKVKSELSKINGSISILPADNQDKGKLEYIKKLGLEFTVCIGNGRNDHLMLEKAGLGIALIQEEGACVKTLLSADIVCTDIISALKLLTNTKRLVATLRS
mmetsp:Transcript_3503/g.2080  ORF Transcript_3503/g.2080 Transcript_3503/m.2080 type:complete len:157 (+) Transcript_3503:5733-6203(+)